MVAPAIAWLAHESCDATDEMLISAAGRVARAYIAETPGVYRTAWTIEDISEQSAAVRNTDDPVIFAPVLWGQLDHPKYGFAMANKG
jgi:hypothetical protein